MPGIKTSVWLGEDLHERWKASGRSLTDLVRLGLDTHENPPQAGLLPEEAVTVVADAAATAVREEFDRERQRSGIS